LRKPKGSHWKAGEEGKPYEKLRNHNEKKGGEGEGEIYPRRDKYRHTRTFATTKKNFLVSRGGFSTWHSVGKRCRGKSTAGSGRGRGRGGNGPTTPVSHHKSRIKGGGTAPISISPGNWVPEKGRGLSKHKKGSKTKGREHKRGAKRKEIFYESQEGERWTPIKLKKPTKKKKTKMKIGGRKKH